MGKMSSRMHLRKGTASQLLSHLKQSSEIQAAMAAGLQSFEVLQDADDLTKIEVRSDWINLDALQQFRSLQAENSSSVFGPQCSQDIEAVPQSEAVLTSRII